MKKLSKFLICIFLLLMLPSVRADAEPKGNFLITGVEERDEVGIYQIGNQMSWMPEVSQWLNQEENNYKGLEPENLDSMTERAEYDFFSKLIIGMIDTQTGEFKLSGIELKGDTQYQEPFDEGYYLILPEGAARVYQARLGVIQDGKETRIHFLENDYSIPIVQKGIFNQNTQLDGKEIWAKEGDLIQVSLEIQLPEYPLFFTEEKQISNICEILQKGYEIPEQVLVYGTYLLEEGKDYALQKSTDVTVYYLKSSNTSLFYQNREGWFYTMDGGVISAKTIEDALIEYNRENNTSFLMDSIIFQEELTLLNLIFSTAERDYEKVKLSYETRINHETTPDGISSSETVYSYTVSALPGEGQAFGIDQVQVYSYGIQITLCDGDTVNKDGSPGVPEGITYLAGGVFKVYQFVETLLKDSEELNTYKENQEENNYYFFYSTDGLRAEVYQQVAQITTDSEGTCSIGGLAPNKYMVMETIFPEGYSLSKVALIIEETDWEDEGIMEGDYILDTLWLDYKGVYLPQTGGQGILPYRIAGILILGTGIAVWILKNGGKIC